MTIKETFQKNYPFITCIKSNIAEYLGIIINYDNLIVSIYDYSAIRTDQERQRFLEFGEVWWWESNRRIPINIFLREDMTLYRPYIKTFNVKDIEVIFGPTVNLSELAEKRTKRRSIQLVRTPKKKI